jgi:hypothetical protein
MKKPNRSKEPYLKVPAHILNLPQIGLCEKVLLAHIYSFGQRGCWQSNKTMAQIFMVSACTISRWLSGIKQFIYVKHPQGYRRTLWAKSHPDVIEAARCHAQLARNNTSHLRKSAELPTQNRTAERIKSTISVKQNCATTNNLTITENNRRTIASPSPLPAGGQAPATLKCRRADAAEQIARFKARFGKSTAWTPLPPEEFARRRAEQLAALFATEQIRRTGQKP